MRKWGQNWKIENIASLDIWLQYPLKSILNLMHERPQSHLKESQKMTSSEINIPAKCVGVVMTTSC